MFLLEVGGFMLKFEANVGRQKKEHWDGTKSSIVEPYPLTKHCAGQILHIKTCQNYRNSGFPKTMIYHDLLHLLSWWIFPYRFVSLLLGNAKHHDGR